MKEFKFFVRLSVNDNINVTAETEDEAYEIACNLVSDALQGFPVDVAYDLNEVSEE